MGLGALADVGLSAARKKAQKYREQARDGVNPKLSRDEASASARSAPAFLEFATEYATQHVKTLKNAKSVEKWWRSVNIYCADLHAKRLNEIKVDDVVDVLGPRWLSHPQAMKDCRQHLQSVLGAATVKGHRNRNEINPGAVGRQPEAHPAVQEIGQGRQKEKEPSLDAIRPAAGLHGHAAPEADYRRLDA
jgi:hypothetical protein